ncbi:MAG TPA: DUF6596 domain-containing protein [Micromonospora sp.]
MAAAWRRDWASVVAAVARVTRDLDAAQDAAQEAFGSAVTHWAEHGVPDNPAAWLTTTARRKALDALRRGRALRDRLPLLVVPDPAGTGPGPPEDDRLRLVFTCCHPALAPAARVALTLRLVCGLPTADVAALFLVPEATMAARLTRAKRRIRATGIPYRVPSDAELGSRLPAVLAVVSLLNTAGHTARHGPLLVDTTAVAEALRLARLLALLMPDEPEVHGLLALLLLSDAHRDARVDADGELVLLADQDRTRWDRAAIAEGTALTRRFLARTGRPGRYLLQAAIAAVHAEAPGADATDWPRVVTLYDALLRVDPSPGTALARAIAVGAAHGPWAGLAAVDALAGDPALAGYHRLPAARATLLERAGRTGEARAAYRLAAALATNDLERRHLTRRAEA